MIYDDGLPETKIGNSDLLQLYQPRCTVTISELTGWEDAILSGAVESGNALFKEPHVRSRFKKDEETDQPWAFFLDSDQGPNHGIHIFTDVLDENVRDLALDMWKAGLGDRRHYYYDDLPISREPVLVMFGVVFSYLRFFARLDRWVQLLFECTESKLLDDIYNRGPPWCFTQDEFDALLMGVSPADLSAERASQADPAKPAELKGARFFWKKSSVPNMDLWHFGFRFALAWTKFQIASRRVPAGTRDFVRDQIRYRGTYLEPYTKWDVEWREFYIEVSQALGCRLPGGWRAMKAALSDDTPYIDQTPVHFHGNGLIGQRLVAHAKR
jgi:hypothetical protein